MKSRPEPALLELPDREALRAWLDANHAVSRGVRVAIGKKGSTLTSLRYEAAVEEALCYGWIDSKTQSLDAERYAVLFSPRKRGAIWARSNKERVARLVARGKMKPAGIAVVEAAKADGSWDQLADVEDLVIPRDLASALDAAPGARRGFAELTGSAQRMTLYWIMTAKRPETRANRIAETVRAAVEGRSPR